VNESATGPVALSTDGRTVYVGSVENKLWAVNTNNPAAMSATWSHEATAKVDTLPVVTPNAIYVAGFDGYIHAVVPATGQDVPGFSFMSQYPFSSNVMRTSSGTLYAANLDEKLYALDSSGGTLGTYTIGRAVGTSPMAGPGNIIYAACSVGPAPDYGPGRLHALTAALDQLLWYFQPAQGLEFKASPVLVSPSGGSPFLVIGNGNGHVYALDVTAPSS